MQNRIADIKCFLHFLPIVFFLTTCASVKVQKRIHRKGFSIELNSTNKWKSNGRQELNNNETINPATKVTEIAENDLVQSKNPIDSFLPIRATMHRAYSLRKEVSLDLTKCTLVKSTKNSENIQHVRLYKLGRTTPPRHGKKYNLIAILSTILLLGYFTIPIAIILSIISIIQFKRNRGKYKGYLFALIPAIAGITILFLGPPLFLFFAVGAAFSGIQSFLLISALIIGPVIGIFFTIWVVKSSREIRKSRY